jgi:hypothetical protein
MHIALNVFVCLGEAEVQQIDSVLVRGTREPHDEVVGLDISVDVPRIVHALNPLQLRTLNILCTYYLITQLKHSE